MCLLLARDHGYIRFEDFSDALNKIRAVFRFSGRGRGDHVHAHNPQLIGNGTKAAKGTKRPFDPFVIEASSCRQGAAKTTQHFFIEQGYGIALGALKDHKPH